MLGSNRTRCIDKVHQIGGPRFHLEAHGRSTGSCCAHFQQVFAKIWLQLGFAGSRRGPISINARRRMHAIRQHVDAIGTKPSHTNQDTISTKPPYLGRRSIPCDREIVSFRSCMHAHGLVMKQKNLQKMSSPRGFPFAFLEYNLR